MFFLQFVNVVKSLAVIKLTTKQCLEKTIIGSKLWIRIRIDSVYFKKVHKIQNFDFYTQKNQGINLIQIEEKDPDQLWCGLCIRNPECSESWKLLHICI